MRVEVAYGTAEQQTLIAVEVEEGSTVGQVLQSAAAKQAFAGLPLESIPVGVFGRRVGRAAVLRPGDRVELYRPLAMDPKEARRRRAR
ncbi:MAG: RnfH family protein [Gammaproteobacteria bacterium]|nr:RnfH family protein [Gammaproteobacteria bacterium]MDE0366976.1 RnfH family protein [Gammaproteobacteria bacterium]